MFDIRPAGPDDAAAIADIWNPVIRDSDHTFTDIEKTPQDIATLIADQTTLVLGDPVCGFATFGRFRGGPGYRHTAEHSIFLSPAAQGKGAGRTLLAALEAEARRHDIHVLVAGIARQNEAAIAFHTACDYTRVAMMPQVGRKFDRWLDLVLMQKIL